MTKAAEAALEKFEQRFAKAFGADTLHRGREPGEYGVISTGSLMLDFATGVGGLVEGRLHEFWGVDAVGKTTMALLAMIEAQRKHPGKQVAWLDMEHSFDLKWARDHGLDTAKLWHYKPRNAEEVADALKEFVASGLCSIVVLDSIGGMIPEIEKEKDADEQVMGRQAKVVTRMVKIAAVEADRTKTVVLLINQVRANLGYGADTTTGGGFALKHSTTLKCRFKRTGLPPFKVKVGGLEIEVGHEVGVLVERNKVAPPRRSATFALLNQTTKQFGPIGIDRADEATNLGLACNLITREGSWYTVPSGHRVQGREKVIDYFREFPQEIDTIRTQALETRRHEVVSDEVAG